jgi:hypothetical protein
MILKNTELAKTGHQPAQFQIEQIHVAMNMARYPFPAAVASISEPDSIKFHRMLRQLDCGLTYSAVATLAASFPITTVQPINKSFRHVNRRTRVHEQQQALPHDTSTRAAARTRSRHARQRQASMPPAHNIPLTLLWLAALTRTQHHHTSRGLLHPTASSVAPATGTSHCTSWSLSAALRSSCSTWK